jgi:hypothetical protein
MRRFAAAIALAAAVAATTACGADPGSAAWVTPSVDVSANSAEVCAATKNLVRASVTKLSESLATLITVKPDDKAAQDRAIATVKKIFNQWAVGMREQAGRAADPDLKAGLTESAAGLAAAATQIKTFDDLERAGGTLNNAKMEAAGKKMEKVCGPIP